MGVGTLAYTTAKTAITGFTRALALEWAPTIQVNAVGPGAFPDPEDADMRGLEQCDHQAGGEIPLQRVGRPYQVGLLVAYLASPAADDITVQTIPIDGGRTL